MLSSYSRLKEKHDEKKLESELVWARLEQSSHHQQTKQLQKLKDDIKDQKELINMCKETEKKAKQHLKDIQEKLLVNTYSVHVHVHVIYMYYTCAVG